ncbi:primosomal protein DnaI [Carboxydothermus islandicus]|uniref:Primosomal protein DnaI n=1 Tax=Carboxydothermus islandicus TaxID=661089 RepID=A0A1L8D0P6_9THEO|nr:ATP-binding protein [Carboxydothermus islandicus]GAV24709.1 primosomal protein DnaI [Carboxydothermus islandicus]
MPKCLICQDRGLILNEKGEYEKCQCLGQKDLSLKQEKSFIPPLYRNMTFADFDLSYYSKYHIDRERNISYYESAQRALKAAINFVKLLTTNQPVKGLYFSGPVGSGKTLLAAIIANEALKAGKDVLFVVVPEYLEKIKQSFGDENDGYLIEKALSTELLILDDLGAHNYTDWTKNTLYLIINHRLYYQLPVVITTNISLEDLENYLGERTTSRIFELCHHYWLPVDLDIRLKKTRGM